MTNRRDFLRNTAIAGVGATILPGVANAKKAKKSTNDKVNLGFIGIGGRGRSHLANALRRDDVHVVAIADPDPEAVTKAQEMISETQGADSVAYTESDLSYRDLLAREDIDAVVISTPWLWHVKVAVDSMKAGKFCGVEVSAANTLEECWDLVNTSEATGVHCMILENVCYRRDVMAVLNMVRQDVFGELIHGRCGYCHDLRGVKFNKNNDLKWGNEEGTKGEARWRTEHSLVRNGDVYPTHGLGPIATMMNINRGNRLVSVTSTATKARGLNDYIIKNGGENHRHANLPWKLGDVVTSVIKTALGESIIVTHDTNLPRPYSLDFRVQGVNGVTDFDYGRRRAHIEGTTEPHRWDDMGSVEEKESWLAKYDHPLWVKHGEYATKSGHGGIDYFVMNAFVESFKAQETPPMDVYDAAAWSSITPLSEESIANNGAPQDVPDFTRGQWMKNSPIFAVKGDKY